MFSFPGRGSGSWSPALPRVSEIGWGGAGWTEVTSWLPSSISESALLGGVGMTVRRHLSKWREVSQTTFQYYLWCFHQPKKPGVEGTTGRMAVSWIPLGEWCGVWALLEVSMWPVQRV